MDIIEFTELFKNFEIKHNMYNEKVNKFYYWEYIRFEVYSQLCDFSYKLDNNYNYSIQKKLKSLKSLFLLNIKKSDILVFFTPRKKKINEYFTDIYFNDILLNLNSSRFLIVDTPYWGMHYQTPFQRNVIFIDIFLLLSRINRKFIKIKIDTKEIAKIKMLNDEMNKIFNKDIDLLSIVEKSYYYRESYLKFISILLNIIKPKIILFTMHSSIISKIICELSKQKNIKTVELQHGVINKYHFVYNHSKDAKLKASPDYLFTFGKYWNQFVQNKNIIVKDVGFPYNERHKTVINKLDKKLNFNKIVIFSSKIHQKAFIKFINEYVHLEYKEKPQLIIKTHPDENNNNYKYLLKYGIKIIEEDLYTVFQKFDNYLGISSTAIYEAISLNKNVYVLKTYGYEYMLELIKIKDVELVSSPIELITKIKTQRKRKIDAEKYFESNSIKNIVNQINIIMSCKNKSNFNIIR